MRINELDHYQDEHVAVLKDMFQATGNCPMNGYLGEDLDRMAYDEDGNFHFSTEHHGEDFVTQSRGVVYGNNLLVKQKNYPRNSVFLLENEVHLQLGTHLLGQLPRNSQVRV